MKQKKDIKISKETLFILVALILIIIFSIAITPITFQNDTYYTVKIGEHIQKYGIDMKDPFSWHEGLTYTYPHWLYDLISYIIYANFGWQGIYITTCILSCILGLSLFGVIKKISKNDVVSFIITIGAMYVLKPYIAARAQLVTFILFIWTIFFIEQFLEKKKWYYALALIIIPIIIANMHVAVFPFYFVLYLPYIAEYLIANIADIIIQEKIQMFILNKKIKLLEKNKEKGKKIDKEKLKALKEKKEKQEEKLSRIKIKRGKTQKNPYKIRIENNKNVKFLILIMIICIFTGLLTPIGDAPYTYLYKTMKGNTVSNINEHLPMKLVENKEAICIIIIFLAVLTFTKAKINLKDLFFITGLCYLMFSSRRQITMFTIIGAIVLARLLMQMFSEYKVDTSKFIKYIVKPIPLIFIIVSVVYLSYNIMKPKMKNSYINKSSYPVDACDYILKNIDLGTAKFYNEYNYGSYMLFRGIPVFIDSRADLYDPQFNELENDIFMDFINVSTIGTYYENVFEKYGITHVITYKSAKVNMLIRDSNDKNYLQLYEDDDFIIYKRLSGEKK